MFIIAQYPENRLQYPASFSNAFFGVNIGHINYPFSQSHLKNGYSAESIEVPHAAVRMVLYGKQLTRHLSAQITYMRPTTFARYNNINGDKRSHSVWMNVAGVTATL